MPRARTTHPQRTPPGFVDRLASAWAGFGLGEWAARIAVAVVFVIGLLATASATRVEGESDLTVEGGEDSETVEQASVDANTSRRQSTASGAPTRDLVDPPPPTSLSPRRPAPPQPSWLLPRRTAPPDDDDESLA